MFLKYITRTTIAIILCFIFTADRLYAQIKVDEYDIKAVFVYRLISYVSWPKNNSNYPVILCVVGNDPIIEKLRNIDKKKWDIPSLEIKVQEKDRYSSLNECSAVYISDGYENILRILSKVNKKPVLSISDANNFAKRGGIIGFLLRNKEVQLQLNVESLEASGLEIDPSLLSVMEVLN